MSTTASLIPVAILLVFLGAGFIAFLAYRDRRRDSDHRNHLNTPSTPPHDPSAPPPLPRSEFNGYELRPGSTYRVKRSFTDYDRTIHEIGEHWKFLGKAFLPYDDGLSLFVEINGQQHHIRMQCREEEQDEIVNHLSDYLVEE